jgi:hypothetical protein
MAFKVIKQKTVNMPHLLLSWCISQIINISDKVSFL